MAQWEETGDAYTPVEILHNKYWARTGAQLRQSIRGILERVFFIKNMYNAHVETIIGHVLAVDRTVYILFDEIVPSVPFEEMNTSNTL